MSRVIGLSGPPGSGKSALASALAARTGGIHIDYDDYQRVTRQPIGAIAGILADHDYDRLQLPALVSDLAALKSGKTIRHPLAGHAVQGKYIYFETPFGRLHTASGVLIDRLIWFDVPLDIALARNLQFYARHFPGGPDGKQAGEFIRWLEIYLGNYNEHVRDMLLRQREFIPKTADLVVDATRAIEDLVRFVISELDLD